MLYLRIVDRDGNETAEAHEDPVFVHMTKYGIYTCEEREAQGVCMLDGSDIYQLDGKESLGLDNGYTAFTMYQAEYEEWIETHGQPDPPDPEDDDPDIPDEDDEPPMTRAELTAKVKEQADTIDMLTECILEMSEIIYGGLE